MHGKNFIVFWGGGGIYNSISVNFSQKGCQTTSIQFALISLSISPSSSNLTIHLASAIVVIITIVITFASYLKFHIIPSISHENIGPTAIFVGAPPLSLSLLPFATSSSYLHILSDTVNISILLLSLPLSYPPPPPPLPDIILLPLQLLKSFLKSKGAVFGMTIRSLL